MHAFAGLGHHDADIGGELGGMASEERTAAGLALDADAPQAPRPERAPVDRHRDAGPHLLRNVAPGRGHWLLLRVLERAGQDAIGARLMIDAGGRQIRRDVRTGYSYLAANDPRVHVGLGTVTSVDAVTVTWPDGAQERFGPFDADRIVELRRARGAAVTPLTK
jgi:hypothetical protein